MGCNSCTNGSVPKGCKSNGACSTGGCDKLTVFDWLADIQLPSDQKPFDCVEIRFKNGRKEFFRNVNSLRVSVGDIVAVEGTPGHDIGVVSLTGELVRIQMRKKKASPEDEGIKKLYRIASQSDIDKWQEAQSLEANTMMRSREMAIELGLDMKIGDVEYQGDKTKATFYYTADGRVDFRQLIRKMADEFKIRIEMRQIGARQEAARLGGIGSCGRELCCSTWLTDFRSVNTSAARYQQLSLNPQKLAGQCGKLKCCLNYELDTYQDALKDFPKTDKALSTEKGLAFFQKMDIFKKQLWYSYKDNPGAWIELSLDRVKEILDINEQGKKVPSLEEFVETKVEAPKAEYENVVGQDSLNRFDNKGGKGKKKGKKPFRKKRKPNFKNKKQRDA